MRQTVISFFLGALWFFSPGQAAALSVCAGERIYLKTGEEVNIQFARRPGCNVGFITVDQGTVNRRIQYPSGKTVTGPWTAGQGDYLELNSEFPSDVNFKATVETVIRFLAQKPPSPAREPASLSQQPGLPEICAGQKISLRPGEEFSFRFGRNCRTPARYINIISGEFEERVTYPSGMTTVRTLGPGSTWNYSAAPNRIVWKGNTPVEVSFLAQNPAQPPIPPAIVKPKVQQIPAKPTVQPQRRTQTFAPPNHPIGGTIMGFLSNLWSFIVTLFWLSIIGGLIYAVVKTFKSMPSIIISHWDTLIENAQGSSMAFYQSLEQSITTRQVPEFSTSRIDWPEGGIFSARREYLRVKRKDLIFDICAAPFGTGFFVSWWLGPKPGFLGFLYGIPGLGILFQFLIRPLTYYKIDTALMFQKVVHNAVLEVVDGMTTAKGIRALSENERKPILRDFFDRQG